MLSNTQQLDRHTIFSAVFPFLLVLFCALETSGGGEIRTYGRTRARLLVLVSMFWVLCTPGIYLPIASMTKHPAAGVAH